MLVNKGNIGLSLHRGGKQDYVWDAGALSGCFLVLSSSVIKDNRKLQQSNTGIITKTQNLPGMKVWGHSIRQGTATSRGAY